MIFGCDFRLFKKFSSQLSIWCRESLKYACICGEIVEEIGLAQATILQHLKELKNAGLIQGGIECTAVCYCIDPKVWNKFRDQLVAFFSKDVVGKTCC